MLSPNPSEALAPPKPAVPPSVHATHATGDERPHAAEPSTLGHRTTIGPNLSLDTDGLDRLSALFKLLSDKTRLTLLQLLGGGETNVSALCRLLELPQPTVSHHLGLLRQSGLIRPRRAGKQVFYRLADRVGGAVVPRDGAGGADLDGSTRRVGHHPGGIQIVAAGLVVQILTARDG